MFADFVKYVYVYFINNFVHSPTELVLHIIEYFRVNVPKFAYVFLLHVTSCIKKEKEEKLADIATIFFDNKYKETKL